MATHSFVTIEVVSHNRNGKNDWDQHADSGRDAPDGGGKKMVTDAMVMMVKVSVTTI